MTRSVPVFALLVILGACSQLPQVEAKLVAFEKDHGAQIAKGCEVFHAAEASPLVQVGVSVGSVAVTGATGVPAGLIVAGLKSAGDAFCEQGPPSGDTTTDADRAKWITDVAAKLTAAAVAAVPAK